MKKLLLSTLAFCLCTFAFAQQYGWVDLSANIPGDPDLSDVFFVSDGEGWVTSGSLSEIYHTTDGGATFEVQNVLQPANAIYMLDTNRGFAGGKSGAVFYTNDGGKNWNLINNFLPSSVRGLTFPAESDTGFICGDYGWVAKIDSIHIFDEEKLFESNLYAIDFPSKNEGWVCGGSIILHYYNGEWTADQSYPYGGYNAIYFINNTLNGWAVGDNGMIIKTTDGQSWVQQQNPYTPTLDGVFFLNEYEGWAVGNLGCILYTADRGTTWNEINVGTNILFRGVQFTSSGNGYTVGNVGNIFKYSIINGNDSTNATLSNISIDDVSLENFNSGTYEYSVELPTGTTEIPQVSATTSVNGATVNITQATALPGTATIIVTAKDGQTQQTYTIHFSVITGIKDVKQANTLNIFPNPVSDILFFEQLQETTVFDLKIINVHGREVCSEKSFSAKSIDVSDLQTGVYFLSLQNREKTYSTRFVKK